MKFREVIEMADALFPNAFSMDEKMAFANDIAALLNRNYIKGKKSYTAPGGEGFSLPRGVTADLVCEIYFDGEKQSGVSVASQLEGSDGHEVRVVYLDVPTYTADDELPVSSPYHNLFLYYILAFICLHSGDSEGFNSNMTIYNTHLMEYEKTFAQSEGRGVNFINLW